MKRLGDNYAFRLTTSEKQFESAIQNSLWDVVICCCNIPKYDINSSLAYLRKSAVSAPVFVTSNSPSSGEADLAFSLGAWDYIDPNGYVRLPWAIKNLLERAKERYSWHNAEALLRQIFDAALDGMIIVDPNGMVVALNLAFTKQFGYQFEDLRGHSVYKVIPALQDLKENKAHKFDASFSLTSGQVPVTRSEVTALHKDGSGIPIELKMRSMPEANSGMTWLTLRDLTGQKDLELQTGRSIRMDSIGRFAGNIAHDLNNALAPVVMSLELMRMQHPDMSELLDTAELGTSRARDLLRELLIFARGSVVEPEVIDTLGLLDKVITLVRPRLPAQIQLQTTFESPINSLWGDPIQILQVLTNLVHNARDAMPEGGVLSISAQIVEIDADHEERLLNVVFGRYVRIEVSDTGVGISEENSSKIFEPFFTTKKLTNGTGLGLSIVAGIIKAHNGFLTLKSEPGQGATFTVYLPTVATDRMKEITTAQLDTATIATSGMVLVVDDDEAVRSAIRIALTHLQFDVKTAADGEEALRFIDENHLQLQWVLTDLNMPNMDGLSLARVVRQRWPNVRLIAMSGNLYKEALAGLKQIGVNSFIEKPFSLKALTSALGKDFKRG